MQDHISAAEAAKLTAAELVRELRYCAEATNCLQDNAHSCPYTRLDDCSGQMMRDATDRLEELNAFDQTQIAKLLVRVSELERDNAAMKQEWQDAHDELKLARIELAAAQELLLKIKALAEHGVGGGEHE